MWFNQNDDMFVKFYNQSGDLAHGVFKYRTQLLLYVQI